VSEFKVRYGYVDPTDIVGRLIRNPNYGGPSLSLNGWTWRPEISKAAKPGFHEALAASVAKEGVRNPVLLWSLPEGLFLTFGGSRVRAAIAASVSSIPAIVNDYTDAYNACPEVTEANWASYFRDPPRDVEFGEYGFDYHYHLERARRANHDPAGFAWVEGKPNWIATEFPWLEESKYCQNTMKSTCRLVALLSPFRMQR
jgi:hypothetical protein